MPHTVSNFVVVIYTNQTYIPILQLFLDEWFEYNTSLKLPIYVISNQFTDTFPYQEKVTYINTNVEWNPQGNHFSEVLTAALPQIPEEYIFWFCEDYIINDTIDVDALARLLMFIRDQHLDMFTFAAIGQASQFKRIDADYTSYGFDNETFYYSADDYLHKFSVQPCIWKKQSLLDIVTKNNISLHSMDCSKINHPEKYKVGCTTYRIFDVCSTCPQKFIISYVEVIRHGVFQFQRNGLHVDKIYDEYLHKLVLKYNLHHDPRYDKFILFDKLLLTTP